jgi:hypothetical protein
MNFKKLSLGAFCSNGIDPNSSGSEAPVITKNFSERMPLKLLLGKAVCGCGCSWHGKTRLDFDI